MSSKKTSKKTINTITIGGMRLVSYSGKYSNSSSGKSEPAEEKPKFAEEKSVAGKPAVGKPVAVNSAVGKPAASSGKKVKASAKKRKSRGVSLFLLIPIAAVLVLALLIPRFLDRSGRYSLPETGWQYYAGSKAQVSVGSYLKQDADGNTHIHHPDSNTDFTTSLPIYFENMDAIVVPNEMVYFAPRQNRCAKTELFSEVYCDSSSVHVVNENKDTSIDRGFLFDGKDFYLFLEPVVLQFNGYSLDLPALSYVEAQFNGEVMVFNYKTKAFLMESPKTAVIAGISTGDYEVSLLNDSMVLHDGTRVLLFTRVDLLESIHDQT